MPFQTTTTFRNSAFNSSRLPLPLFEFEDKLFHWLIGVKCQNLCRLNLSFYFNHLCHFKLTRAFYHLTVVKVAPLHSHHSVQSFISVPKHTHPLSLQLPTKSMRFCTVLCNLPSTFCLLHTTFISTHTTFPQLHFANAVVKLLFPSTFSPLCHSNHTNYIAAPSHKKSSIYFIYIIPATFILNSHSTPHFNSTSAHHPLHHPY